MSATLEPAPPSPIGDRLRAITSRLPPQVQLIAISKKIDPTAIRIAYRHGQRHFGESRVQELDQKRADLRDLPDITWHLIGHLQSNKAQRALDLFDWIHSVDSLKLAQRLDRLAEERDRHPKICLQVKLLDDPAKFGWTIEELWQDLPTLATLKHLDIRGIMAIPPLGLGDDELRTFFGRARQLRDQIRAIHGDALPLPDLSLGMSNDYAIAIEAGATLIRLGRTIFGDRTP
jgi:pyridoxal phosphate enzyme (YggS family)